MIDPFTLVAFFIMELMRTFPLLKLVPAQCKQLFANGQAKSLTPAQGVIVMNALAITLTYFVFFYYLFLTPCFGPQIVWFNTVCALIGLVYIWIATANTNGYMECQGEWMRKVGPPDDICRN